MMLKPIIILFINLFVLIHSCDFDWYPLNSEKCIKVFNVSAPHDEAKDYCKFAYKAKLLSIDSKIEQRFWTFHLFRYLELADDVWIQMPSISKNMSLIELTDNTTNVNNSCYIMQSFVGVLNQKQNMGIITTKNCNSFGLTVCQIVKSKEERKPEPKIVDPNREFFPNYKIKTLDGEETEIFTGLYYNIVSKYNGKSLISGSLGRGICSLNNNLNQKDCESYDNETLSKQKSENHLKTLFTMTSKNRTSVRLKRSFNTNELAFIGDDIGGLSTIDCLKDESKACDYVYKTRKVDPFWILKASKEKGYYEIQSKTNQTVLGVNDFIDNGKNTTAFSLYKDPENKNDSRILFSFVLQNYTFNAQLYSVEFDRSLEDIVKSSKQQISLIDTAVINNNSPASLSHEVSVEKRLTESLTTTFGTSLRFLRSMSLRDESSTSDSDTSSNTKTFSQSASEAVSHSLSQTLSKIQTDSKSNSKTDSISNTETDSNSNTKTNSNSNTKTDSNSNTHTKNDEKSASIESTVEVGAFFAKASVTAKASMSSAEGWSSTNEHSDSETNSKEESNSRSNTDENSRSHSKENSNSHTNENSNSHTNDNSNSHTNDNSNTNSTENSKSSTKGKTNSTENASSNEKTIENSHQVMTTKEHTYRLSKIVEVPSFSAVKISSYANWISDMKIDFKLNIKFTATALRRRMDGKASNEYRTLDAEVVKSLMKFHNFPGIIIKNHTDTVFGQITGSMTASIGLDSVFMAKDINMNEIDENI